MDLALSAVALISLFIFVIAYIIIAYNSFRHHFLTGVISLIPGLNLLILPTIWYKTSRSVMVSFVAILVGIAAWFAGAHSSIPNMLGKGQTEIADTSSQPLTPIEDTIVQIRSDEKIATPVQFSKLNNSPLPEKALYYLLFEQVNRQHWDHLKDSLIRITFEDETTLEGRVANILPDRLVIKYHRNQQTKTTETQTSRIVNIEKLVKQPAI